MADFTVTISVADAQVADLADALRQRYNLPNDAPLAQIKPRFQAEVTQLLSSVYHRHMERKAPPASLIL